MSARTAPHHHTRHANWITQIIGLEELQRVNYKIGICYTDLDPVCLTIRW